MLDDGLRTVSKDPVWRKFSIKYNKNVDQSHVYGLSGIWKATIICTWNIYIICVYIHFTHKVYFYIFIYLYILHICISLQGRWAGTFEEEDWKQL